MRLPFSAASDFNACSNKTFGGPDILDSLAVDDDDPAVPVFGVPSRVASEDEWYEVDEEAPDFAEVEDREMGVHRLRCCLM